MASSASLPFNANVCSFVSLYSQSKSSHISTIAFYKVNIAHLSKGDLDVYFDIRNRPMWVGASLTMLKRIMVVTLRLWPWSTVKRLGFKWILRTFLDFERLVKYTMCYRKFIVKDGNVNSLKFHFKSQPVRRRIYASVTKKLQVFLQAKQYSTLFRR